MSEMICPACHRAQPSADRCVYCQTRLRIAPLLSEQPLTTQPGFVTAQPVQAKDSPTVFQSLGYFLAQEIYFEDGITVGRLVLSGVGFLAGFLTVSQLWVVVSPFWGWALAACGLGAWGTRRLYRNYAQSLLQNRFGEFSPRPQVLSPLFQQSFLLWLLLSASVLGSVLLLNFLTAWFAVTHQVALVQAWVHAGKSRSYYAELAPWPGHSETVRVSLSRQEWEALGNAKQVKISTRKGLLGIELRGEIRPVPATNPSN